MGNANDMPEWMRDRLAKQARRSITWTDRVRRVKEGESYLLLLCTANGAYEEHIVTARRAPDGEDLFELREDTGAVDRFVMYATGGGTLSPTRALAERPLAVLCTRRPYHQLTVLWRGDIIATIAYTAIAYDTPAMGMVTVTTLFGTTITYPRERIRGIV